MQEEGKMETPTAFVISQPQADRESVKRNKFRNYGKNIVLIFFAVNMLILWLLIYQMSLTIRVNRNMLETLTRDLDNVKNRQEFATSGHPAPSTTASPDFSSNSTSGISHSTSSATTSSKPSSQPTSGTSQSTSSATTSSNPSSKSTSGIPKHIPSIVLSNNVQGNVTYECERICEPPNPTQIHNVKVRIEGYEDNINWQGNAARWKDAREKAAYETIKYNFPELLNLVSYEDKEFNTTCINPISKSCSF